MSVDNLSITRFSPHTDDAALLDQVIHCYQGVFADPPWNETWPYEQVRADLLHEITPESSCWIAKRNDSVVGFCWGYPITAPELEEKLKVSFVPELERVLDTSDGIAYQDELGVLTSCRGIKIAKILFTIRLEDFERQGLRIGVVRTREFPEASVTFRWFTEKLGYQVIARYPGTDGRVVLAQRLTEVRRLLTK